MDEIVSIFIQESREQLTAMETALLELEANPDDSDRVNAIFRAAHTIKGAAGVIECNFIVKFTHVVENALDKLRNGEIAVSGDLVALLLACDDHIGTLVSVLESGQSAPDEATQNSGDQLLERLHQEYLDGQQTAEAPAPANTTKTGQPHADGGVVGSADSWHISLRFGHDVLRNGMDPLSFLRFLATLGEITNIETIFDGMPPAEAMDPESCYLGFEIRFLSSADKASIEQVFDFVRDECELTILPPNSKLVDYVRLMMELPEDNMRLGEMLVRIGALTAAELEQGLKSQEIPPDGENLSSALADEAEQPKLGEILIEQRVVQPELVEAAVAKQKQVSEKKAVESRLIRIQADKLDTLIDLVGELVIAGAGANLLASRSGMSELTEATSLLNRLVEQIRDSALQLRMVQVGETFSRFQRVVRDVSREIGKEIDLVISGGETELDKSVVEKIGDPLMHLVRNAIDHGIEPAAVRQAAGKASKGRLELNAYHDSGSIVIEVNDDGGGLNKQKIHQKALDRGLIQPGQNLSDQEIYNLIFEPGFSTADQVSNLSGRGVGMDVVKRNIQSLRGVVEVTTSEGQGTRFGIRLPLTLAIIDGFLVAAGRASYVIPLDTVVECLELEAPSSERNYINLRGEVLPFIRLRDLFEIDGERPKRENVVVVRAAGQKAGIVIDALLGEFQTVIKPLGTIFRHLRGIGGSTILGSGEVALILDVQALTQLAVQGEEHSLAASIRT